MASFYVIRGKDNGQHFAIRGANATIGREAINQIQLRDTEISRKHARIIRTSDSQFEIVDNGSSNGTFVNSRRVDSQILQSGDRVQVGRTLMIFTGGPELYSTSPAKMVEIVNAHQQDDIAQIRSSIGSRLTPSTGSIDGSVDGLSPGHRQSDPQSQSSDAAEANHWEIVYQVSQAINRTVDLNDLLRQVLDLIFQWIECDRSCILMLDDISGRLSPIYSRDRSDSDGAQGSTTSATPLKISRTILDHVVSTKEGVLTGDAQDDSRWKDAESVASLGVHEAICVPMLGRYGLVGAIYVDTSTSAGVFAERAASSSFDDDHLKLMIAIAGQAALAIEDTQFYRAMVQSERLAVMGQTIANLSHHVKNILQGVSGGNYLVEDGLKKQDLDVVRQGWTIVEKNQSRISNLVMDMLSFSKEREPDLKWQDICTVIDDIIELVGSRAQEANVSLVWQRPGQPLNAEFDSEAMHRAILNVVVNALDASSASDRQSVESGQVTVKVGSEKNFVSVTVTDDGKGIPSDDAARVFSPFESTKGAHGTGLGLPVSQKILREHGGEISFTSAIGAGTTFVLNWPIGEATGGGTPTQPG